MTILNLPAESGLDFDEELAKLAKSIVQKATLDATPFDESVDAFKALTAYYALRLKHKQGDTDDGEGGFSFDTPIEAPPGQEHQNDGQAVRSRPRRSTS